MLGQKQVFIRWIDRNLWKNVTVISVMEVRREGRIAGKVRLDAPYEKPLVIRRVSPINSVKRASFQLLSIPSGCTSEHLVFREGSLSIRQSSMDLGQLWCRQKTRELYANRMRELRIGESPMSLSRSGRQRSLRVATN